MAIFQSVYAYLSEHPELVVAVLSAILYWLRAIMPRKPPESPFWFQVWVLENKLLALPWDQWFGKLHLPGKVVPYIAPPSPEDED